MDAPEVFTAPPSVWSDGALDTNAAAEFLGVRRSKFLLLCKEFDIPTRYLGAKPVFPRRWLVEFLESAPTTSGDRR